MVGFFCFVFTSAPYLIPYIKGPVYLTGKAHKCLRRGDLDNALAFANRAVQFGPDFSHTYETRAEVLEARGDFRASIRDYTKVISLREYGALAQRGRVYENMGEHDNASADYCEALLIDRTESRLAFNVGCVALDRVRRPGEYSSIEQRHPDAVSSLLKFIEEAIEGDPDNQDLRECRELILRSEGDGSIPALSIGSG
jgi:tetratricopeptide (TPR) repeat protein